jgi:hypothetical protein
MAKPKWNEDPEYLRLCRQPLEEDEIRLNKDEMTLLWELGVFTDFAYFFLVLRSELTHRWRNKVEKNEHSSIFPRKLELSGADFDYLMQKWRGTTPKNDDGDLKEFTADLIMAALARLGKKDLTHAVSKQLSLFLGEEAPFVREERQPDEQPIDPMVRTVNLSVVRPSGNEHLN